MAPRATLPSAILAALGLTAATASPGCIGPCLDVAHTGETGDTEDSGNDSGDSGGAEETSLDAAKAALPADVAEAIRARPTKE